jgi:hypothetical protein
VGPRAGLDREARGKILCPRPGIEPGSPGGPARSQDTILPELTRLLKEKQYLYIRRDCWLRDLLNKDRI